MLLLQSFPAWICSVCWPRCHDDNIAVLPLLLLNHLPTYREVRGRGKLIYEVPLAKRGGPSAMQLVWGMGHFVNEVLRQLFLFGVAVITSQSVVSYRRWRLAWPIQSAV